MPRINKDFFLSNSEFPQGGSVHFVPPIFQPVTGTDRSSSQQH